jgi:hypothetical protein
VFCLSPGSFRLIPPTFNTALPEPGSRSPTSQAILLTATNKPVVSDITGSGAAE